MRFILIEDAVHKISKMIFINTKSHFNEKMKWDLFRKCDNFKSKSISPPKSHSKPSLPCHLAFQV